MLRSDRNSRLEGRVAVVFGTRPEIIKISPVLRQLGEQGVSIFTGQHHDANMSSDLLTELQLPDPQLSLGVSGGSRGQQLARIVEVLAQVFSSDRPRSVVVQGDTTSVLAAALAANANDIPVVHVEAGLRSFDRRMPEEHNRVLTDHLADLLAAPTETAAANLRHEGIQRGVVITGNTVVDVAKALLPPAADVDALLASFGVERGGFVLATFHRPENVDDGDVLRVILKQLAVLPMPVILPLHPRTRQRLGQRFAEVADSIRFVEPVGYRTFLGLASGASCLVSDSGGVQEEASILRVPIAVVRNSTERPEIMGTFGELVPDRSAIGSAVAGLVAPSRRALVQRTACPYGTGDAGQRIVSAMVEAGLTG